MRRKTIIDNVWARLDAIPEIPWFVADDTATIISQLTVDGTVEPQIKSDGNGGAETIWVADGRALKLHVCYDGTSKLHGFDDGHVIEFATGFTLSGLHKNKNIRNAKEFLNNLSAGIRYRKLVSVLSS
jgi:hypothetical protein